MSFKKKKKEKSDRRSNVMPGDVEANEMKGKSEIIRILKRLTFILHVGQCDKI